MKIRCEWCGCESLYIDYHDEEWGVPVHDDRLLFEFLSLEGAQAGLSWLTILKKRESYRRAFDDFDYNIISSYNEVDVARLIADSGIVRNRLKIESVIRNARGVVKVIEEFGTFDLFLWRYVEGRPVQNCWKNVTDIPSKIKISELMSKDLKRLGFNFVGPTICYAFMQAVGMVNDHVTDCFRYKEIRDMGR